MPAKSLYQHGNDAYTDKLDEIAMSRKGDRAISDSDITLALKLALPELALKAAWYDEIMYRLQEVLVLSGNLGKVRIAHSENMEWVVSVGSNITAYYGNPAEAVNRFVVEVARVLNDASTSES